MNNFLNYFIVALIIGYFVVAIIRIVLNRRLVKKTDEYQKGLEEKMKTLQKDIESRTHDLQESMQMINQEYSKLMVDLNKQKNTDIEQMLKKIDELKTKRAKETPPPVINQKPHVDNSDQSDSNNDSDATSAAQS